MATERRFGANLGTTPQILGPFVLITLAGNLESTCRSPPIASCRLYRALSAWCTCARGRPGRHRCVELTYGPGCEHRAGRGTGQRWGQLYLTGTCAPADGHRYSTVRASGDVTIVKTFEPILQRTLIRGSGRKWFEFDKAVPLRFRGAPILNFQNQIGTDLHS
jgi:hypothetical protein